MAVHAAGNICFHQTEKNAERILAPHGIITTMAGHSGAASAGCVADAPAPAPPTRSWRLAPDNCQPETLVAADLMP